MWFEYTEVNQTNGGTLLYLKKEKSLSYTPRQKNDYSLLLGQTYCGLDIVVDTGEIVQLSGLNPMKLWVKESLFFPKAPTGQLFLRCEAPLLKGSGGCYGLDWKTFFDPVTHCICIGGSTDLTGCSCIEFCNGIVAALKAQELVSIWGKITIV